MNEVPCPEYPVWVRIPHIGWYTRHGGSAYGITLNRANHENGIVTLYAAGEKRTTFYTLRTFVLDWQDCRPKAEDIAARLDAYLAEELL